eukprot:4230927-Amphidinium_carterae.1
MHHVDAKVLQHVLVEHIAPVTTKTDVITEKNVSGEVFAIVAIDDFDFSPASTRSNYCNLNPVSVPCALCASSLPFQCGSITNSSIFGT